MINNQVTTSNYIKYAWIIISKNNPSSLPYDKFSFKYARFIKNLIINSQLTSSNLVISLYYLYKHYHQNNVLNHTINNHDNNEVNSIIVYNIIISLVLCNKCLDDQSYTLKTWLIIINNSLSNRKLISIDLKLLNYLEGFFLSSLNYELGFKNMNDCTEFWEIFEAKKRLQQQPSQPQQLLPQPPQGMCRKRKDIYDAYDFANISSPLSITTTPLTTTTALVSTPINTTTTTTTTATARVVSQFYSPPPTPSYKKRRCDSQYTYMPSHPQPQPQPQPPVQYNYPPQLPSSTTFNFQPMVPILLTQQPPQMQPQPQPAPYQQRQYIYNWS
ncbi:hypothetical protein Cantr_09364 [Candida viswanathii]|uniref:Uncharacterized protein n=1 Tax=Candida viswanathii TaxID=5486 RepID=A0A367YA15_9ASCO|nr:hypothetical protein Cantr_09364 [Candida viswanathii]